MKVGALLESQDKITTRIAITRLYEYYYNSSFKEQKLVYVCSIDLSKNKTIMKFVVFGIRVGSDFAGLLDPCFSYRFCRTTLDESTVTIEALEKIPNRPERWT